MTADDIKTVYLAGPMRGLPEFNFPAFEYATWRLRLGFGLNVWSPAEHDIAEGFDPEGLHGDEDLEALGFDLSAALAWDLAKVCESDAVVVLPGWSESSGTLHEIATAELLGKPVFLYEDEGPFLAWLDDDGPGLTTPEADDPAENVVTTGEVRVTNALTGGQKGTKPERHSLIPVDPLATLARVYAYGAEKYAAHNWRKGYDWSLSYDAVQRHLQAFWGGEDLDPESGLPHVAHAMFHCCSLLTFMAEHPELDDRPSVVGLTLDDVERIVRETVAEHNSTPLVTDADCPDGYIYVLSPQYLERPDWGGDNAAAPCAEAYRVDL